MSEADSLLLRMDVAELGAEHPSLPDGIFEVVFEPLRHAKAARNLLNEAYANGGGDILDYEAWWLSLSQDAEYSPEAIFVLEEASSGKIVGFAQCWVSGFVKDIAIAKTHRRLGLGAYLMSRVVAHFEASGHKMIGLKVKRDNPNGAIAFYESLGFYEADR